MDIIWGEIMKKHVLLIALLYWGSSFAAEPARIQQLFPYLPVKDTVRPIVTVIERGDIDTLKRAIAQNPILPNESFKAWPTGGGRVMRSQRYERSFIPLDVALLSQQLEIARYLLP